MINLSSFTNAEFERGAPTWKEGLWWFTRSILFMGSFPIPSLIKVSALRLFGATIGTGVVIRSRVNITFPWKIRIGNNVWIGDEVYILSLDQVIINDDVCISQRAFLCTGSHDFRKPTFDLITGKIVVGSGSWIGAQTFIPPHSEIPPGTMVKATSIWKNQSSSTLD